MARLIPQDEYLAKLAESPGLEGVVGFDSDHPWVDHIVGGDAEGADPNQFDPEQLAEGVEEEMEHTNDPNVAAEIAMDHLIRDPDYYQKLKAIEGEQEKTELAKSAGALMAKMAMPPMGGLAQAGGDLLRGFGKAVSGLGGRMAGNTARMGGMAGFRNAQRAMAKTNPIKVPWGKAALLGGAGLGLYGVSKAVPWAARQLTQASSMPLAHGAGWSPVPYGYGYTPYGEGTPNLGSR